LDEKIYKPTSLERQSLVLDDERVFENVLYLTDKQTLKKFLTAKDIKIKILGNTRLYLTREFSDINKKCYKWFINKYIIQEKSNH